MKTRVLVKYETVSDGIRWMLIAMLAAGFIWAGTMAANAAEKGADLAWVNVQLAAVSDEELNDPLEPVNRAIFNFNEVFQDVLLRPASKAYEAALPNKVRSAVGNSLDNMNTPVVLVNDLLQGSVDRAVETIARFMINSVAGIGGMADVASDLGIEAHDEDFGQTLGKWGVGEGLYLVLPVFGPSNPRDAVGQFFVDGHFDAVGNWASNTDNDAFLWTRKGLGALDTYSGVMDELEQVKKTSVDYYAAIRSMYRQKRMSEINNGSTIDLPPIPDLSAITPEASQNAYNR
ncbi:MAG: VacJ family lipoprotein [Rhodospirillaceae bacterium]|nr:VacJ family lipoprotein [Rhodospirillaceae bacterium]MBT5013604.1 VacJ family lipoprotein [Rhodospirillaceae bacterium]